MKIERIEVEGHRDLARIDWRPADLTVLAGGGASDLAEAVFTLSHVPRGWSDLGAFYGALNLPLRETIPDEEAHTTRWRLTCVPRGDSDDHRRAEYELGIYPAAPGLPWEIRYEALKRFDDFDEVEVLRRDGSAGEYSLTAPRRGPAVKPRKGRESFAGDIPVLGARQELFEDPAVRPFAQPLACWSWFRGYDLRAARADRVYGGFDERLVEGGGNLTNALHNLCDLDATRERLHAAVRLAEPTHLGFDFHRDDGGHVGMVHRAAAGERRASELPEEFARALCALAAVYATAPPPLLWFEPSAWEVSEALGPALAEGLVSLSARAQVVLHAPPTWLATALLRASQAHAAAAPGWTAQRVTVESGPRESAITAEPLAQLTGLSPVP